MIVRHRFMIYRILRRLFVPHRLALWLTTKTTKPTPIVVEHGWVMAYIKCHCCGKRKKSVRRRRQRTSYVDDEKNWVTLCDECAEENDAYWRDQWADYYAGLM